MQIAGIQAWLVIFNAYMSLKQGKMGTFHKNRDPLETRMVKKVPK